MNLVSELEALKGDTSDMNEIIDISGDVVWGELVQLDDGGDFPRPAPGLEDAIDPLLGDDQRVQTTLFSDNLNDLIRHCRENWKLGVRMVVDLFPKSCTNGITTIRIPTVAREFVPSLSPMGTWVKRGVAGLLLPINDIISSQLILCAQLRSKEVVAEGNTSRRMENTRLVPQLIGIGHVSANPDALIIEGFSFSIGALLGTHRKERKRAEMKRT